MPRTWAYINQAVDIGKSTAQSRWAQVADLVRLEVVYRHGGIYLDSNFQVSDKLFAVVDVVPGGFLGANEEDCLLDCGTPKFLSNSFFAAQKQNVVLGRLVSPTFLNAIDFHNPWVNTTTGPYYLRKGIRSKDRVQLLPTSVIYPVPMFGSDRPPVKDKFLINKKRKNTAKVKQDCYLLKAPVEKFFPHALAVYHVLGGSWLPK